jgi:uncharacterized protein YcbX
MTCRPGKVEAIYRYPVKGLSADSLARTRLAVGETVPCDRLYAVENGCSGFAPKTPSHYPKNRFLTLMQNERLASLQTTFDELTHTLVIRLGQRETRGDLRTPTGRAAIERFLAQFCAGELRGWPSILSAPGHSFSDIEHKVVSIINRASVIALEQAIGVPVDPLRFRGNLYVEGWPAWYEFDLVGHEIGVGQSAGVKIVSRILRCNATNVDPATGVRDLAIPKTLNRMLGHACCGVYGKVVIGGDIAVGDAVVTV